MFQINSESNLKTPLYQVKGLGPKSLLRLTTLGLETLEDLLFYYPFRWDDFSQVIPIANIDPLATEQKVTVAGTVSEIKNSRSRWQKMSVTEAIITDNTGSLKATWYNQPFLARALKPETPYRFFGKLKMSRGEIFLQAPSFESGEKREAVFIPVYHVTDGLTPKMLRYYIKQVLPLRREVVEYLPTETIQRKRLIGLAEALAGIHFPKSKQALLLAKRRLGFDELFLLQLNYQLRKKKWEKKRAVSLKIDLPFLKKTLKNLPFELTGDQKIALWQILKDGEKEKPMNRLLEGDVGSGKTVVAALAALNVSRNNQQAALMAPTEILAQQHFNEIIKITTKTKTPCCLLTRSLAYLSSGKNKKTKKEVVFKKIREGKVAIIVGTHSIIQESALFKNLALAIIDEQHRFGVKQRLNLIKKSEKNDGMVAMTPHLLSMTATPIPRTLALTIYGDLDISLIKEMPKGRKAIATKLVLPEKRQEAYDFIKKEIEKGRQAFVICPLIEESDILDTKAAEVEYQRLKETIFPNFTVGLLHGRMEATKKKKL